MVTGALGQIGTELVEALRSRYGAEAVVASDVRDIPNHPCVVGGPFRHLSVIDADALNNLKDISRWWEIIPKASILTPHPGEMSAITNLSKKEIQSNRIATSIKYAKKWNVILILKGAMTVIAFPSGKCYINPFASSILATAGTGDVLAGIIAGFIAQELKQELAAISGV